MKTTTGTVAALLCAATAALALAGCGNSGSVGVGDAHAATLAPFKEVAIGTDFWAVQEAPPAGAKPGDILRAQKRGDAPAGAQGWSVVYVSEIAPGKLAYVSGEVYYPAAAATAPRDIVLWNHETAGLGDACAPSRRNLLENSVDRVPAISSQLAAGRVVVMSDYPGLGLPGPALYMAGQPNARASLDMLRVAQKFPDARASARYVMYGWSQGGQTTMWAENIAASYAPEFTGLGAALIAPAVRIRELTLNSMKSPTNAGYVISTLPGIQAYMPELKYRDFLSAEGMEQLPALTNGCYDIWELATSVRDAYQPGALTPGSSWWNALTAVDNFTPRGSMPFVMFQGTLDTDTPVALNQRERSALCKAGSAVEYNEFATLNHLTMVPEAAKRLPAWMDARFKGQAPANNCPAP